MRSYEETQTDRLEQAVAEVNTLRAKLHAAERQAELHRTAEAITFARLEEAEALLARYREALEGLESAATKIQRMGLPDCQFRDDLFLAVARARAALAREALGGSDA